MEENDEVVQVTASGGQGGGTWSKPSCGHKKTRKFLLLFWLLLLAALRLLSAAHMSLSSSSSGVTTGTCTSSWARPTGQVHAALSTAANQGHIGDRRQARRARPNGQVGDRLGGEGVFLAAVDACDMPLSPHLAAGYRRYLQT